MLLIVNLSRSSYFSVHKAIDDSEPVTPPLLMHLFSLVIDLQTMGWDSPLRGMYQGSCVCFYICAYPPPPTHTHTFAQKHIPCLLSSFSDGSYPKDEGSSQEVTQSLFVGESRNRGFNGGQNKYWGQGGADGKMRTLPRNRCVCVRVCVFSCVCSRVCVL